LTKKTINIVWFKRDLRFTDHEPLYLAKNEEIRNRFNNEAATMARLQHPNIVSLFDYYSDEEGLYLIMELVEGVELETYLRNIGCPLDEHVTAAFMKQLLDAFSHAHDKGVVHRDIKPANILIADDGTIKVLDFGIAKIVDGEGNHNLTKTGTQIGTVFYMSPEQVQGKKVDLRSDIYSLGVTFYQMLTAQNPYFNCTTEFDVYSKIVQEQLPNPKSVNPNISDAFVSILNKATALRFKAPLNSIIASCAANASNLLVAVTKGKPVNSAIFLATNTSYPFGVFKPVPTAVPPNANSLTASKAFFKARMLMLICCTYPLNSCPKDNGVASIK
jgi:serine/threonine protein kinase